MSRLLFLGNGWADCVEIWYAPGNPLASPYAVVTDGVSLHVRTCTPRFCISQTARPIVFKFGVWVSSHYLSAFHKSWVGQGLSISARAHVHTALLYLRNGSTDCVQIWYVGWRSLSKCFPQVMGGVGHLCTCAHAPPSPYLRIRVANSAKIWCVTRDRIVTRFTRVGGGATTFARSSPVSLSRKPLSPDIEVTQKTGLSLSLSLANKNINYIYNGIHYNNTALYTYRFNTYFVSDQIVRNSFKPSRNRFRT